MSAKIEDLRFEPHGDILLIIAITKEGRKFLNGKEGTQVEYERLDHWKELAAKANLTIDMR
jgi:hypothetical protein